MLDVNLRGVDYLDVNYVVVYYINVCDFNVSFEQRVFEKTAKIKQKKKRTFIGGSGNPPLHF